MRALHLFESGLDAPPDIGLRLVTLLLEGARLLRRFRARLGSRGFHQLASVVLYLNGMHDDTSV
jgi:hypothetical protein